MGVQERSYLAERPIDEPVGQTIAPSGPVISLEICDLQKARLNQGAAGELPAAQIAIRAMFQAYYRTCSDRHLKSVQKFEE